MASHRRDSSGFDDGYDDASSNGIEVGEDGEHHKSSNGSADDVNIDEDIESNSFLSYTPTSADGSRSEATWWSYGSRKGGPPSGGLATTTHQSARLTLTGDRMFCGPKALKSVAAAGSGRGSSGTRGEEVWDLSDSLAELYQHEQLRQAARFRNGNGTSMNSEVTGPPRVDVESWLAADPDNGFVRVYSAFAGSGGGGRTGGGHGASRLVPCTTTTTAQKICLQLGLSGGSLHVQYAGDSTIRRLELHDQPLLVQNDFLAGLGYNSVAALQAAGVAEDLSYLVKFYAGKPVQDSTFCRRQLKSVLNVKKGGLLQQWVQRLCAISGTRLLIYKDGSQNDEPTVMQLVKGVVEEVKLKGHDLCLKLTSTINGEKLVYLSFTDAKLYGRWLRRCKKATDKLPTMADLSSCQLEYLPENIFVNDQLAVLNLQHNTLKERPLDEDIYVIGWIEDLAKFRNLRSLNLADNDLRQFPLSLCSITTLVQLNLASNKIEEIPSDICVLKNLQELHLHNNHLSSLPKEIASLRRLFVLILAFNNFTELPPVVARLTNNKVTEVENVIMAGNQIEQLSVEAMVELRHAKKIDFRMNRLLLPLAETMHLSMLERLTHLDVRDNRISDLDITAIRTLEYLNCERNAMGTLLINGSSLRNLFASCNCLESLVIIPKPEWLLQIDVSDNCLELLPEWLSDCFFLQKLVASKNFLIELPPRLLMAKKLKMLRVDNNSLTCLPDEIDCQFLEELYIQHNQITHLPADLLLKANKLRILNASKNRLVVLPPLHPNNDLNKVRELYLSGNSLGNDVMTVVCGFSRLKVLHLAQNELTELFDSEVSKLEMLCELNVSTNQLSSLPPSLCQLKKLDILRAHSNYLRSLPDFHKAKSLRVLDVGHNQLTNVSVTNLMASQISLLDMSLNSELKVDPREYRAVKSKKHICLVDLTGQNRQLPGLTKKNQLESIDEYIELDVTLPWKVGFSETSGNRNKLCIAMLKILRFNSDNDSLFGMFDGGRNADVPKLIIKKIANVLREEMKSYESPAEFMKYAMLTMHRNLHSTGQRLGASGVLIHIQRHSAGEGQMNHFTMSVANVGDTEAVLCRRGEATMLTRRFVATHDRDECQRICQQDGIITEDGKVNGTTVCTRLLGCAYLYPHVLPDPYVVTVTLRNDDEFIIVANGAFWEVMSPEDAVEEIYEIGNPVVAAKHLQDLAQGCGALENVSVLVIRLNTDRGPSLARLRPNRQVMSVDDVEAAAAHEAAQRARRAARAAVSAAAKPVNRKSSYIRAGVSVGTSSTSENSTNVSRQSSNATKSSFSAMTQRSSTNANILSESASSSIPTTTQVRDTATRGYDDDSSTTPTTSFMSSTQTMRMSFTTGDEHDDEDDDRTTTANFTTGNNHNDRKTDEVARDVIRTESVSTAASLSSSSSKSYTIAAVVHREPSQTSATASTKRPPPIAPKPRFVKKNASGYNSSVSSNNSGCRESIGRNIVHPGMRGFSPTRRRHECVSPETSGEDERDERRSRSPGGGSSSSSGVARMVFEDSATSTEDVDDAVNRYQRQQQQHQQRTTTFGRSRTPTRIHAADIVYAPLSQPVPQHQMCQSETTTAVSMTRNGNGRMVSPAIVQQKLQRGQQVKEMDDRDGRPYRRTPPSSPVGANLTTAVPGVRLGPILLTTSQQDGNRNDFESARF